jgi:asparagine synthase (glutamine-hydrolysing)
VCGIVGIGSVRSQDKRAWLPLGRNKLKHRGPDDSGEWWSCDFKVGLAHQRLSIQDLSALGHQPMQINKGSLSIVYNGEIYNFIDIKKDLIKKGYKFESQSDTEVILASYDLWGVNCVNYFNGAFAFAIYDFNKQIIFLARDRAGEKPFFYSINNNEIIFSSELKALMLKDGIKKEIDYDSLDCYLSMGFIPADKCILKGFKKLPPAHTLIFNLNNGSTEIDRYWELPEYDHSQEVNENDLLDKLEELLENSVKRQLVSDVPVGVLLSGGLDSSLITAMAVRNSNKINTFSIGFPNFKSIDETKYAELISSRFDTNHTMLTADSFDINQMTDILKHFDEPIMDSSMLPTWLVSNLVKKHCSVALGGDGGDELFGGYTHYQSLLKMQQKSKMMPKYFRKLLSSSSEKYLPTGFRGRNFLQQLGEDYENNTPIFNKIFDPHTRKKLMKGNLEYRVVAEELYKDSTGGDLIQRLTRKDFNNYLAEDILVKVDRVGMMNSLEIRAPFLDQDLIEFAFQSVPSNLKVSKDNKKILLKKLASKVLPTEFDLSRKQGFSIPLPEWLAVGPFRNLFKDILLDEECFFDHDEVLNLLKGQDSGYSNSERLFSLVVFELWRKEYGISQ